MIVAFHGLHWISLTELGITISISFYFLFWSSNWCTQGPKAKFGMLLWYSQPKGQQEPYSILSAKFALSYLSSKLHTVSSIQSKQRWIFLKINGSTWVKHHTNCRISNNNSPAGYMLITTASVSGQAWLSKAVWVHTVLVTEQYLIQVTWKLIGILLLNSVEAELNPLNPSSSTPLQKGICIVSSDPYSVSITFSCTFNFFLFLILFF